MCKNGSATAANLMKAIEPTLINLETIEGIATTPEGQASIKAYDAALLAIENWTPGTYATVAIEAVDAFVSVFNTLPFSASTKALVDVIAAGVTTVIGILTANSPAPAPAPTMVATATEEESQAHHVMTTMASTEAKVTTLVPGFKRAIFTAPAKQYDNAWNKTVVSGGFSEELMV